jgi:hypothetical protein
MYAQHKTKNDLSPHMRSTINPGLDFSLGSHWFSLLEVAILDIQEVNESRKTDSKIVGIVEKEGLLKIYLDNTTNDHAEVLTRIEDLSYDTCPFIQNCEI